MELIFGLVLVHTIVENRKILIFDGSTFLLPIEVDFPERTENQASGIFGLVRDSHVYKENYTKHHCKFVFFKISKILFSDRYVHCVFVAPFLEV